MEQLGLGGVPIWDSRTVGRRLVCSVIVPPSVKKKKLVLMSKKEEDLKEVGDVPDRMDQ